MDRETDDAPAVLLVEDNPGDARLIERELRTAGRNPLPSPDLVHVESLEECFERLAERSFDLVLLDLGLRETTGLETLDRINERLAAGDDLGAIPIVVLTGLADDVTAIEAIKRGAQDYLVKGSLDSGVLERSVRYALKRHRQERALRRQNQRLERFANVLSHDLRNPLNVAAGHLDLVAEACDHESIDAVDDALERMETIIEDMLAIARGGRTVEEPEPVELADLAEGCWETVSTGSAELIVEAGATIEADESRLRQLVENLLRNAVEHGSASDESSSGSDAEREPSERPARAARTVKGGAGSAGPGAADDAGDLGDGVTIRIGDLDGGFYVEDDGPGIPPEDRSAVFEAGYTTDDEGTGFGLSIVEEIAAAHGWHVEITEGSAGGARFEFTGVSTVDAR